MGITTENLTLIDICPEGAVSTLPLRGGGRGGGAFFSAEAEENDGLNLAGEWHQGRVASRPIRWHHGWNLARMV